MEIKIIYLEKVQCDNQAKSIIYHYLDVSTRCSHPAFFKEVLKKQFDIQLPSPLENYSLYKFFSENNLSHLVYVASSIKSYQYPLLIFTSTRKGYLVQSYTKVMNFYLQLALLIINIKGYNYHFYLWRIRVKCVHLKIVTQ